MRLRQAGPGSAGLARAALLMACAGVFLTAMDQTVVVTALPPIISDLNIGATKLDHAAWIVNAYLLGFVIAMPLMGRVSDIYGRRRIFLLCLGIFGAGSILCGLAPVLGRMWHADFLQAFNIDTSSPGLIWLIAARFMQALGGGAVVPIAMAIASDFYGRERLGVALGVIGAVTEAGGVVGPLYGAIIAQRFGWQFIFYLNVPLVIALMVAAWRCIPAGKRLREGIDWLGAIVLGLGLTCLSLGLAQQGSALGPSQAHTPAPHNNPLALVLAAALLLAFALVERKVRWPVVDLSLFRRLSFSATALLSLLVGAALIIAMVNIPLFVDTVLQLPVLDSGLALLRLTAMIPVGALLGGWLCNRCGSRYTALLGLLFTAAGFYLMSRWTLNVNWLQLTISVSMAGFGFGLVIAPIGTSALNAVRTQQAGMASAIVTSLRMVGMILGLAGLTSWELAYFKQLISTYPARPAASVSFTDWAQGYAAHAIAAARTAYSAVFFTSMILCLIAIVPALCLGGRSVAAGAPASPALPAGSAANPRRRGVIVTAATTALAALLVIVLGLAAFAGQTSSTAATPPASPSTLRLALDEGALSSLFVSQLGLHSATLTDLKADPRPGDRLILSLKLHIAAGGIQRVMPIEIDGALGMDARQNIHLTVLRLKRDGGDAGPASTATMQQAIDQMLSSALMPALRVQLRGAQILSVHTSDAPGCAGGAEMLVLQLQTSPIRGIAAQSMPAVFCLQGPLAFAVTDGRI